MTIPSLCSNGVSPLDDVKALLSADFSKEELSLLVNQQINLSYEEKKKIVGQKINEIDDLQKGLIKGPVT